MHFPSFLVILRSFARFSCEFQRFLYFCVFFLQFACVSLFFRFFRFILLHFLSMPMLLFSFSCNSHVFSLVSSLSLFHFDTFFCHCQCLCALFPCSSMCFLVVLLFSFHFATFFVDANAFALCFFQFACVSLFFSFFSFHFATFFFCQCQCFCFLFLAIRMCVPCFSLFLFHFGTFLCHCQCLCALYCNSHVFSLFFGSFPFILLNFLFSSNVLFAFMFFPCSSMCFLVFLLFSFDARPSFLAFTRGFFHSVLHSEKKRKRSLFSNG